MSKHVIVGAGPVGRATAELLQQQQEEVVVVTRSGRGTGSDGVRPVALDASDAASLSETAAGAVAL